MYHLLDQWALTYVKQVYCQSLPLGLIPGRVRTPSQTSSPLPYFSYLPMIDYIATYICYIVTVSGIIQAEQLKNEWKYKHAPGGGPVAQQLVLPFQNWKSQLTQSADSRFESQGSLRVKPHSRGVFGRHTSGQISRGREKGGCAYAFLFHAFLS